MNGKRTVVVLLILAMVCLLPGCWQQGYKDGTYTAQAAEFSGSGWKELVELTVEDGKIAKINWDALYVDDSIPIRKKQYSKSGLYGMLVSGASEEWYDQAVAAEQYVLRHGIDALNVDSEGRTDAVTGCTVHVNAFDSLLRDCLEQAKK